MTNDPKREEPCLVYLIRHAESGWNAEGRFQGQADTDLSPLGRRQAMALGRRLATLSPSAVYTSDLSRAKETARLAASMAGLEVAPDPSFREVNVGKWQGLTFDEIRATMPESFAEWRSERPDFRFPGGETYEEATVRAMRRLEELAGARRGERLAVVSHGGVLRALVHHVLGLDRGRRAPLTLSNAGVSAIAGEPGRWRLVLLNDTCHLETPSPAVADEE